MTGRVVTGDRKLIQRIRTIQEGLPSLVSRDRLGDFLLRRMQDRYSRRVDPDGVPWADRSAQTRGDHPLLEKHGTLRGSIGVLGGMGGSGFGVATGAGFRIGVRSRKFTESSKSSSRTVDPAVYGRAMQLGLGGVPKRRFIGIGKLDIKAVDSLLRRELTKLVGRS